MKPKIRIFFNVAILCANLLLYRICGGLIVWSKIQVKINVIRFSFMFSLFLARVCEWFSLPTFIIFFYSVFFGSSLDTTSSSILSGAQDTQIHGIEDLIGEPWYPFFGEVSRRRRPTHINVGFGHFHDGIGHAFLNPLCFCFCFFFRVFCWSCMRLFEEWIENENVSFLRWQRENKQTYYQLKNQTTDDKDNKNRLLHYGKVSQTTRFELNSATFATMYLYWTTYWNIMINRNSFEYVPFNCSHFVN